LHCTDFQKRSFKKPPKLIKKSGLKKQENSTLSIIEMARKTIQIEQETLIALRDRIDHVFEQVIHHLLGCNGRLVVTGVGKSALVGQKITATLNSTGTPALFMHAADAVHGDLGMIQSGDTLLILSKSGETAELKVILPVVQQAGIATIGISAESSSFLAKQVDYFLHTPIAREADPNNLAPTASSIAQMAVGDAIASCLVQMRGFTPNDFALNHPGGTLGKRLYLRVKHLYKRNAAPQVLSNATLEETILEMTSKCLGATAVLEGEQLLGVITDGDLRRMLVKGIPEANTTAGQICSPTPKVIDPDALATEALQLMHESSITQLIVCNQKGQYLGMLHLHDLIREGIV